MPHEGLVHLGDAETGQVITHSWTFARQAVPNESGPYELCFDDQKFGALVGSDGKVVLLEDWLTTQVYESSSGQVLVAEEPQTMSTTADFWSLRDKLCMFDNRTFAVKFDVGDLNFTTNKVSLPRGGFRYLWSAMGIYRHLQMDAYKGVASKWVYESLGSWEAKPGKAGLVGHFVKSHASVQEGHHAGH